MEEDIELIIVVTSERVIGEKLLMEASQSFVKIEEVALSFLEERIFLEKLWKKRGGGKFLYNKLERALNYYFLFKLF